MSLPSLASRSSRDNQKSHGSSDSHRCANILLCALGKGSFASSGGLNQHPAVRGIFPLWPPPTLKASRAMRYRVIEWRMAHSFFRDRGVNPNAFRAAWRKSAPASINSTLGNSQSCAFTTPAGRWRTRKRPWCLTTKAANRLRVAETRGPRFGNWPTRFWRHATQFRATGQIPHFGCRGVQTSAPNSMSDWLRCEHGWVGRAACPGEVPHLRDEDGYSRAGSPGVSPHPRPAHATKSSASRQSRTLVSFSRGFSPMPKMRVSTRMTLPSRMGVG